MINKDILVSLVIVSGSKFDPSSIRVLVCKRKLNFLLSFTNFIKSIGSPCPETFGCCDFFPYQKTYYLSQIILDIGTNS